MGASGGNNLGIRRGSGHLPPGAFLRASMVDVRQLLRLSRWVAPSTSGFPFLVSWQVRGCRQRPETRPSRRDLSKVFQARKEKEKLKTKKEKEEKKSKKDQWNWRKTKFA